MATAVGGSHVGAGKKLKNSLKKKKMKMVARAVASELEDEGKDATDSGGSVGSCESEKDHFSSDDESVGADNEDEVEPCGNGNEHTAEVRVGINVGWADAMAKILKKKTPKSKSTILVKNRELEKEKEKLKQERLEKRKQLGKKREWEMCRVKPDVVKDKETERNLQRIATRGVVQLFNAMQKHQKNVDEKVKEAGSSIRKRAKLISTVSKKDFISVLRGMDTSTNEKSSTGKNLKAKQTEVKSEEGPGWTILHDDFMMGASMKDWDKKSDDADNQ
ncbi:RRP15-like protein [Lontra canadensis]|uniref:RRP15-like protein n=1 Tax=Lontra canadensis TaxID=76717 RepID=UPI0013F398E2|nr:RRP15-like protein [Lontra canadensis]